MSEDKLALVAKCRADFKFFAQHCLKIRDKAGAIEPFVFNAAQRIVHERIEQQHAEKGWVRALILKGRQQGISTYVGARYYRKASLFMGRKVYILSHEQTSSDGLFEMVDRYQRNNPLAPHVGASNAKELVFDAIDGKYTVATAGTKEGGRGGTISLFHGSEVAYWQNAPAHFAASVQGVPLLPGTEVILESTSAGAQGEFYDRWKTAERGEGDYIPIFIPWWESTEYSREPEIGFELSQEESEGVFSEQEYADTYKLSLAQMAWRRAKIFELKTEKVFRREYPATPAEAWTTTDDKEPYISPMAVTRAQRRFRDSPRDQGAGPLILGVDPASQGGDRFAVAARRGLRVLWVKHRNKIDTLEGTAWLAALIEQHKPARMNIDAGNIGAAIVTNLKAMGPKHLEIVRGIDFGSTSQAKHARPKSPGPKLRRDEMWMRMKDWLDSPEGVAIPTDDALMSDITSTRQTFNLTNDIKMESKEQMRARKVRSPDLADAIALTFASNEFFKDYATPQKATQFGEIDTPRADRVSHSHLPAGPQSWMG